MVGPRLALERRFSVAGIRCLLEVAWDLKNEKHVSSRSGESNQERDGAEAKEDFASRGGALSALAHRNYRIFFGAQILSLPGTWLQLVAEGWLVYQLTGSALALGVIRFLHTIPVTLLSVFAGGLADRYDKRRLLIVTQSIAMLMAFALFVLVLSGRATVWQVGVLALILGVVNAFDIPTRQSFIIELVGKKDLMNAIALNSSVFNAARIVGPAIAGVVISTVGVAYCFLFNALSFLFVIVGYCCLRLKPVVKSESADASSVGIRSALRVVWASPVLRALLGMSALNSVFGMSYTTLMPIFAEDIWHVGPRGLGALLSANGVGALLGSVTLAFFSHGERRDRLVKLGASGFAASMIAFSFCPNVYMAMGVLLISGWFMVSFYATTNTLVQGEVEDHLRGRIMGLYTLSFIGLIPLGAFLAGWVAVLMGAPMTVLLGALICLVGSGFLWRVPLVQDSGMS